MTGRRLAALAAIALMTGLLGAAPASLARLTAADATTADLATDRLDSPANLAGTGGSSVALTWTPSSSSWASGYQVLRSPTSGSGYTQVDTVTPVTRAASTDSPANGTWYYVLRTVFHSWTSVPSNEASVRVGPAAVTTPVVPCTGASNAAETTNAGNNDGYESNASRACDQDGSSARDNNSGTSTTNSCTAATKDKHRFWGYALGLPASVSSIDGITVTARAGQSNNGGTTWLCIQLSSDGGATWTAARQVVLASNGIGTYPFGGVSETWGRSWAVGDFGAGFMVRVIDSSTQGSKDFLLDALGVAVTYTP
jgi:hypothetical protein